MVSPKSSWQMDPCSVASLLQGQDASHSKELPISITNRTASIMNRTRLTTANIKKTGFQPPLNLAEGYCRPHELENSTDQIQNGRRSDINGWSLYFNTSRNFVGCTCMMTLQTHQRCSKMTHQMIDTCILRQIRVGLSVIESLVFCAIFNLLWRWVHCPISDGLFLNLQYGMLL